MPLTASGDYHTDKDNNMSVKEAEITGSLMSEGYDRQKMESARMLGHKAYPNPSSVIQIED